MLDIRKFKEVVSMKPIIKYRGGKYKEIPLFKDFLPNKFDTYIEPFFGGGALYFYLEPKKAIINDFNARLVNFYKEIQSNFETVSQQLSVLQKIYDRNQSDFQDLKKLYPDELVINSNEDLYYKLRDMFNHKTQAVYLDAVIYFFINKTAYSGMIRYNSNGEYNVPFGRYKSFNTSLLTKDHSKLLESAKIFNKDYSATFDMAKTEDFVFLDPPYDCKFSDYGNIEHTSGFGEVEHQRLAANFKNLSCKALMVIGNTQLTSSLYHGYIKGSYFKSYSVNIRNRFKSQSQHLIVTNY